MKHYVSLLSLFLLMLCPNVKAQTFLDGLRKDEQGKGKVTVQQSAAIDELVNGKRLATVSKETTPVAAPTAKPAPAAHSGSNSTANSNVAATPHNENHKPETTHSNTAPSVTPPSNSTAETNDQESTVDTRKKVMRNSYKVKGYRIQVFSGGNSRADKQKAEQIGTDLKRLFPNQPIYVHFYSPSWKCRMGNFRDQAEAQRILKQVKEYYKQACIIKGPISVQY